jgi:DNA-binding transcriptional MocR family regulator
MREGLAAISTNIVGLMRYQSTTGGDVDKEAASSWLSVRDMFPRLDRVAITPGARPTIFAMLMLLTSPGDTILSEGVTYAGMCGIAARLSLNVEEMEGDADGILPDALARAIKRHGPKALYLNLTLNNPTTRTIPADRREAIAAVLNSHGLPLIKDDAYGFIPAHAHAPAALATMAPELTWRMSAGRPNASGPGCGWPIPSRRTRGRRTSAQCCETSNVMPSPLSMALATRWIVVGAADAIRGFVRAESAHRQAIASEVLAGQDLDSDPSAFNIWLRLPPGRGRAEIIGLMAGAGIGVMPSDGFTVIGATAEAIRVCLGGGATRTGLDAGLSLLAGALDPANWHG